MQIIKKEGNRVKACRLGSDSPILKRLVDEGLLRKHPDGSYELFTRETANGTGELMQEGDYVKLDCGGNPYPNRASFFLENHRHISGDEYEQIPRPLAAWDVREPENELIRFLQAEKGLLLRPEEPERYFTAPLWGTVLSAARDAVIVFYRVERDEDGAVTDVDFSFVARQEFEDSYRIC